MEHFPMVLNEIAWMGTASNSAEEWIELKNTSTSTVSLNGWQLIGTDSNDNKENIALIFSEDDSIEPNSYFLLERTDDGTVPNIVADRIFTGSINDSDFILRLFSEECVLIDESLANSSWPGGQKEPERKTMERTDNLEWQTSYSPSSINGLFGTPKSINSEPLAGENQIPTAVFGYLPENPIINQEIIFDASSSTDPDGVIVSYLWDFGDGYSATTGNPTITHSYVTTSEFLLSLQTTDNAGATSSSTMATINITAAEESTLEIVINEIAWMGTSATNSENEWIELYNNTDSDIDLAGWKISKNGNDFIEISTSTIKSMATSTIRAKNYYLLERTDDTTINDIYANLIYTGSLGNYGEKLELRDNNEVLIDAVDCSKEWFAGTANPAYVSMERINSLATGTGKDNWGNNNQVMWDNWKGKDADGKRIYGTPSSDNSISKSETRISGEVLDYSTLPLSGSPYVVTNTLFVPTEKTLIIEPGVTLKFEFPEPYPVGHGPKLEIMGKLIAIGEENKMISFIPTEDYWPGIVFYGGEKEEEISSQLEYVIVDKAGNWWPEDYSSVSISKKAVSIKNSVIQNYPERGIKLMESDSIIDNVKLSGKGPYISFAAIDIEKSSPIIKNCGSIEKNKYGINIGNMFPDDLSIIENNIFNENVFPIYSVSPRASISGNKGDNNINNKIYVWGSLYKDVTWFANDFPYTIYSIGISPEAKMTISSGVIIEIEPGGVINIEGTIAAEGSPENPIHIFVYGSYSYRSIINFNSHENISKFENVIFSKIPDDEEGQSGIAIIMNESSAEFDNVVFNNNSATGLYLINSPMVTIKDSLFIKNWIGLRMAGKNNLSISNVSFKENSKADICWPDGGEDCESLKINPNIDVKCYW
jgi:hypothetical protein